MLEVGELYRSDTSHQLSLPNMTIGGGRGMRIVRGADTMQDSIESASREALTAFGNGNVFLEKYCSNYRLLIILDNNNPRFLTHPRHIEVQIIGDSSGNVVHLFERDCTIQRKHQKIIEIAPAIFLDPKIKKAILKSALAVARRARYGIVHYQTPVTSSLTFQKTPGLLSSSFKEMIFISLR